MKPLTTHFLSSSSSLISHQHLALRTLHTTKPETHTLRQVEAISAAWSKSDHVAFSQINGEFSLRAKADIVKNAKIAEYHFIDVDIYSNVDYFPLPILFLFSDVFLMRRRLHMNQQRNTAVLTSS